MITRGSITKNKLLNYVAVAVAICTAAHYFSLHWSLITDPMPLSARESSSILIAEDYAEGLLQGILSPYAVEHYPQSTSVYGPVYTLLAAAVPWTFETSPYFLYRCLSGVIIAFSALLCGGLIAGRGNWQLGLLAAVYFYITQVASTCVGAGADAPAVLFYILGILAILRLGTGWLGLGVGICVGLLGLFTKPYVALIIPAILVYTYLFHSPRRALVAAAWTAFSTGLGSVLVGLTMPTYFHAVFEIHTAYATRDLEHLISQLTLFTKLNAGLILAFALAFPWLSLRLRLTSLKHLWGGRPLVKPDIGFDRFLALIAAAALLLVLGWHGGAYLTYFNHLLLAPLLLGAFQESDVRISHRFWVKWIVLINVILLAVGRPQMREANDAHLVIMSNLMNKHVLVDPVLEPIARLFERVDLVDNGQAEYLVKYDQHFGGTFAARSEAWAGQLAIRLESGEYDGLYLSPIYFRKLLLDTGRSSELLHRNYKRVHVARLPIYFSHFKDRKALGKGEIEVYYFERRENIITNDSSG